MQVRFPAPVIFFPYFFFMIMMVERCAAAQASVKQKRRHAGMSAANVGASFRYENKFRDNTNDVITIAILKNKNGNNVTMMLTQGNQFQFGTSQC